jgi:hypothetical protein
LQPINYAWWCRVYVVSFVHVEAVVQTSHRVNYETYNSM